MSGEEGLAQPHSSRERPEDVGEATGARLSPTVPHCTGSAGLTAPTASRSPAKTRCRQCLLEELVALTLLHLVWAKRAGRQYHQEQPPEHRG